jgi:hypothetical protein
LRGPLTPLGYRQKLRPQTPKHPLSGVQFGFFEERRTLDHFSQSFLNGFFGLFNPSCELAVFVF